MKENENRIKELKVVIFDLIRKQEELQKQFGMLEKEKQNKVLELQELEYNNK